MVSVAPKSSCIKFTATHLTRRNHRKRGKTQEAGTYNAINLERSVRKWLGDCSKGTPYISCEEARRPNRSPGAFCAKALQAFSPPVMNLPRNPRLFGNTPIHIVLPQTYLFLSTLRTSIIVRLSPCHWPKCADLSLYPSSNNIWDNLHSHLTH